MTRQSVGTSDAANTRKKWGDTAKGFFFFLAC